MSGRALATTAAVGAVVLAVAAFAFRAHHGDVARVRGDLARLEEVSSVLGAELLMAFPDRIHESSGVALSARNEGLFWTHNDSGGEPVLYAVRPEDGLVAELRLTGAEAEDWEDISAGPCIRDASEACLYVGDIGTNIRPRSVVGLLVVAEPALDDDGGLPEEAAWDRIALAYDGGARNAEALAVSSNGELVVVDRQGLVFGASRRDLRAGLDGALVVLRPRGALPLPPEPPANYRGTVTAATIQGNVLVARTYNGVLFFREEETGWRPARQPCWVGHLGPRGEGIDVAPPDIVYLTRERSRGLDRPAGMHRVACAP